MIAAGVRGMQKRRNDNATGAANAWRCGGHGGFSGYHQSIFLGNQSRTGNNGRFFANHTKSASGEPSICVHLYKFEFFC